MDREDSDRLASEFYGVSDLLLMNALLEIRESSLHGLGVFARVPIVKGQYVGCMNGPVWDSDEFDVEVGGTGEVVRSDESLEAAATELVEKLEAVHRDPRFRGIWSFLKVHGCLYTGQTYEKELLALKSVLGDGK